MKLLKILFLVAVVMALLPTNTEAANWVLIDKGGANTNYIDKDSITNGPGGSKEVWEKSEYAPPIYFEPHKKYIANALSYTRFFGNKSFCSLDIIHYYTDGTNSSFKGQCSPIRIAPESVGESEWEYLFK